MSEDSVNESDDVQVDPDGLDAPAEKKKRTGKKRHPIFTDPELISWLKNQCLSLATIPREVMPEPKFTNFIRMALFLRNLNISQPTLYRWMQLHLGMNYSELMQYGQSKAQQLVTVQQLKLAEKGHYGMLKHLGVNLLGQKEYQEDLLLPEQGSRRYQLAYSDPSQKPVIEISNAQPSRDETHDPDELYEQQG